jgi:non-lysosomal glucosylceramidase
VEMTNSRLEADHPQNGQVVLAVVKDTAETITHMLNWSDPQQVWAHFYQQKGQLPNSSSPGASPDGQTWNAAMAAHVNLQPGQSRTITFVLSWYFPNRYLTYHQDREPYQMGIADRKSRFWLGNQYSNQFDSALAVTDYVCEQMARLTEQSRLYRDRFFGSTLPWAVLESAAGPISTIRTPTCIWVEDGRFHGYEGCHGVSTTHGAFDGCCPMNCTHVWNYEMALAKLFPDLEQGMRRTDLIDQISPWGSIPHRTTLPRYLPRPWTDFIGGPRNPAMDGELGTVLKTYREVRHGAEQTWFDEMWPPVKHVMEHVMNDYDSEGDGVIRGEQPNTYDISIYGPNTFIGSLYLAALRAAEEMARLQNEDDLAQRYRERFETGRQNYDKICWTGEYYAQIVDLEEYTEQQFGNGCHIDQLLGQWWAFSLDLGYVLPEEHVRTTISNIYRFNRREAFKREEQRPRVYMDERDRGLYICTWPHGGKPEVPTQYSDEVWSGLEYPAASMLLHEGFTEEALTLLEDIRDRHDGTRRSPWNEIECGDHYVRPMASWTLLEEASGYNYNAAHDALSFAPRLQAAPFTTFFITGSGWGFYSQDEESTRLGIDYGSLRLRTFRMSGAGGASRVYLNDNPVDVEIESGEGAVTLRFSQPLTLFAGEVLEIS